MDELLKMLDSKLGYTYHETECDRIVIHGQSECESANCPYCGVESDKVHSQYERKFQDLPIQGRKVVFLLKRRKFFCQNTEFTYKTFAERFEFFEGAARNTKRLQSEILRVSLTQSSISASEYLRNNVADVGKSTICNLLKKETIIMNKDSVRDICIDDFAIKKRQRYGIVMVDIETHRIVDMIESREGNDVAAWLKEYPNIRIVSRDGSQTYAAAITAAHPKAKQVSDRFHIIKNLHERAAHVQKTEIPLN